MSIQKIANWFLTDAGKKCCFYGSGAISTCVLFANFLPHTLLLDQYKEIVHLYKNGLSVQLPKKLQERFQTALDLLEVETVDKHLYKPFHCYGFDVMSAGSSYSRFGVIVGLPANFTCDNVDMVDRSKIKVNHESVIWESEDGKKLLNSLVLSENAQIYAMSKEIKFRQTPKPLLDTIFATSSCVLAYSLGNFINNKFNLYNKPRGVRVTMYGFVGLFVVGLYTMLKDVSQIYFEENVDRELKQKNTIFVEGGKEYYTKILERNQALRKMMGKEGERLYSVLGNENYLFRTKHIPVVQRKLFFEESQK
ncbi:transmembrane protein 177, partial [Anoplophora glabripennis]|uniref:transmembrane protein 177 n=1 Tax=Anoplophora glabripennis TaxID=217634 RepID=UPI0008739E13